MPRGSLLDLAHCEYGEPEESCGIAAENRMPSAPNQSERRTREIGLRKVMGASRSDILRFIGWISEAVEPPAHEEPGAWPGEQVSKHDRAGELPGWAAS